MLRATRALLLLVRPPVAGRRVARRMSGLERTRRKVATITYVRAPEHGHLQGYLCASDDEDSDDEEAIEEDGGGQEKKGEATVSTLPRQVEEKPTKNADTDAKACSYTSPSSSRCARATTTTTGVVRAAHF